MFESMHRSYLDYPFATHEDDVANLYQPSPRQQNGVLPGGQGVQTSRLPAIPSASPNPGTADKSIVPLLPQNSREPFIGGFRTSADLEAAEDRLRIMESRLGGTEKSNRALLEEVIRLQGELRMMVRRNEESLKDEKVSRQQMEGSMQIVNDLITQLSNRIRTAEDKILEERSTLSSLVNHTKGVEKAVVASQKNLSDKKDNQTSKIQELSLLLSEIRDSRDQLEKQAYAMTEEIRSLRSKVDGQGLELNTTIGELKLKSRRLEEENKLQLDALRKQGDMYSTTETSTIQLRGQVENRLSELRDVIMELRTRQDQEASDRRSLENTLASKLNVVQQGLADQNRKREEAMHAMDMIQREKEHVAENDKLKLQGKMTETVEEVNRRLLTKEIKLREELQEKFNQLERTIQSEQQVRLKYESTVREENDKRWMQLKKLGDEEMGGVKEMFQSERQKNKEAVQKLDESISLIEKHLAENKRQSDKVVAAEIKSRKLHEKTTADKLEHLNEKLALATSSLQQAIGGAAGNLNSHAEKIRGEMKTMINTSEQATTRSMTDMDARLQGVKQKLSNLETQIDGRISEALELNEATAILAQNLREKVESISLWQDVTSQTIRELNTSVQGLPNDIYAVEEKYKLLKSEVDSRVTTEADARIRDIEFLKHELSLLKNKRQPEAPTMQDLQETQASIRKLAESIQTVKTVVGMKIQSEQKLRLEGLEDLQIQINRLKSTTGMVSAVNSTVPMYARNDLDAAYEMEDFMRHDITQDIPYGRSTIRQSTTRTPNSREAVDPNGYAAQYSRNRNDLPEEESLRGGALTGRTPLETVSEKDDEDAWNLLHSVAYGKDENDDKSVGSDPIRAASNVSQRSSTNKDESGHAFANKAKTPEGKTKTPERAVTRHNSLVNSPVDEAQSASLKGAPNPAMDLTDSTSNITWSPQPNETLTQNSKPGSPVKTPNRANKTPRSSPKTTDNGTKTPKNGTKTTIDGGKTPESGTKKPGSPSKKPKSPMKNTLEWQPATPDGRKSNQSRKSIVKGNEEDKPSTPLRNTDNDPETKGEATESDRKQDVRSAEQILAEV